MPQKSMSERLVRVIVAEVAAAPYVGLRGCAIGFQQYPAPSDTIQDSWNGKMKTTRFTMLFAVAVGVGILAPTLVATDANAISRYTTTAMSCNAVKQAVKRDGAALLQWTSPRTGNRLYDRYVRNRSYCDVNEVAKRDFVPTSDRKSCGVRKCVPRSFIYDDDSLLLRR